MPTAASAQAISNDAKQHFKAGVAFLEDPDGAKIEEAYREFKQAYEMSKSSKVLGNLGICAMKLERDGEAIDALASYLHDVDDITEAERKQVTQDLQTLRTSVIRLGLTFAGAPKGAEIAIVDVRVPIRGDKVTNTYKTNTESLTLSVRPGHHSITAKLDGFAEAHWEVDSPAGGNDAHTFQLEAKVNKVDVPVAPPTRIVPPPVRKAPSVAPWILMGAGGALGVAGVVTGIFAIEKTNSIANHCPSNVCPTGYPLDTARGTARKFVTATDVLIIGGSAVAASGFVWWVLTRNKTEQSAPPATIGCAPQGCMATVNVAF